MRFGSRAFLLLAFVSLLTVLSIFYFASLKNENSNSFKVSKDKKVKQRDYIDHPVPNYESTTSKSNHVDPKLHIFRSSANKNYHPPCVTLNTFRGPTPICTFDPSIDTMISSYIRDYRTWEQDLLNETGLILQKKPYLTFVDIGCNIGAFSLFSVVLGVRVIAVDILDTALELLQTSLSKGGFQHNTTLVLNAISDTRELVKVHQVDDNPGGSYIEHNTTGESLVDAILLDDLMRIIGKGSSIFLKMDIEGNEHKALLGGSKFFQLLSVEYILMEWMLHRYNPSGREIIQFLLRNGMLPYESLSKETPLDLGRSYQWPDNIFWRKR